MAVTSTIPGYFDGRYLRNGPNPVAEVDPETYHWFLGEGMVHLPDRVPYGLHGNWAPIVS